MFLNRSEDVTRKIFVFASRRQRSSPLQIDMGTERIWSLIFQIRRKQPAWYICDQSLPRKRRIVGHLPMEISRITKYLLDRGVRTEASTKGVLLKKVFLEISQSSLENNCARVSFLIKLQSSSLQLYLKRF